MSLLVDALARIAGASLSYAQPPYFRLMPMNLRLSIRALLGLVTVIGLVLAAYRLGLEAGREISGSADLLEANLVSVKELGTAASDQPVFYQGSNQHFHYFRVQDVGYFKMRLSDSAIPQHGFSGDGSGGLGLITKTLTIEEGKLKAGDAPTGGF